MRGRRFSAGIGIVVAFGFLTGFETDVLQANWKYIGGTQPDKQSGRTLSFFDSENIQHLPNGDVRVWIREVDASEIDGLVAKDKKLLDQAAEKVARSYYPPYYSSNVGSDQGVDSYIEMITWEEAANHADIRPRAKLQYEIRCMEKTMQTVTAMIYKNDGTTTFASDFDSWTPIVPESTGDSLRRLLCK